MVKLPDEILTDIIVATDGEDGAHSPPPNDGNTNRLEASIEIEDSNVGNFSVVLQSPKKKQSVYMEGNQEVTVASSASQFSSTTPNTIEQGSTNYRLPRKEASDSLLVLNNVVVRSEKALYAYEDMHLRLQQGLAARERKRQPLIDQEHARRTKEQTDIQSRRARVGADRTQRRCSVGPSWLGRQFNRRGGVKGDMVLRRICGANSGGACHASSCSGRHRTKRGGAGYGSQSEVKRVSGEGSCIRGGASALDPGNSDIEVEDGRRESGSGGEDHSCESNKERGGRRLRFSGFRYGVRRDGSHMVPHLARDTRNATGGGGEDSSGDKAESNTESSEGSTSGEEAVGRGLKQFLFWRMRQTKVPRSIIPVACGVVVATPSPPHSPSYP